MNYINPVSILCLDHAHQESPYLEGRGSLMEVATKLPIDPDNMKERVKRLEKATALNPTHKGIKRDLFFFSTLNLYSAMLLPLAERHLTVMGLVHNDGVGDYYHILNVAEFIKSKFPDVNVTMVVSHEDNALPSKIRKPFNSQIETIFCEVDHDHTRAYPIIQKAEYIIEMSQQIDDSGVEEIVKNKLNKYRYIGEYGNLNSHPMGIKLNSLGIVIKDNPLAGSLHSLKNTELKQVLFGTKTPSQKDLENYLKIHEPFVGYLKMGSYYQMGLIYTTASYLKCSEKQVIDLMIPSVKLECLDFDFLKEQGIAKIKVIKIEKQCVCEEEIILDRDGKVLRIINPFPLEQEDFHTLAAYTNPLVGCTGDHSLSEVISFDRLPFYELRSIKTGFVKDIIKLSGRIGNKPYYLQQYFKELSNIYDDKHETVIESIARCDEGSEESRHQLQCALDHLKAIQPRLTASALVIATLLKRPELIKEACAFNRYIKTRCSFNPMLQKIVTKEFVLNSYPDLNNTEKKICKNYFEGRVSLKVAIEQLISKIQPLLRVGNAVDSLDLIDAGNTAVQILEGSCL